MFIKALAFISAIFSVAGFVLLVCLWWPHRKTRALSSLPWICLFLAYRSITSRWSSQMLASFLAAMRTQPSHADFNVIIAYYSGLSLALASIPFFLVALMLCINLASLLPLTEPPHPLQTFLAPKQRFQSLLGVLLLLSGMAPTLLTFYVTHLITH